MFSIQEYKNLVSKALHIVIIPHQSPDADALGSSLALSAYMREQGHFVQVISPSAYPLFLEWMPGVNDILVYEEETAHQCVESLEKADLIFCLDFSSYNRLKDLEVPFRSLTGTKVFVIDHHLNPEIASDFMIWDVKASSTCELVYRFIEELGDKKRISQEIGECLYAGIVTDTSSFKHPSTTQKAHYIAADLMDLGVNTNRVQRLIYDNSSENRLRFLGFALKEKLKVLYNFRTAYFTISDEELQKFSNKRGDTEGLVNYALSIKDIVFAAILIEKSDCIKVSFRSVGTFPANELADLHFSGGGHRNAAGGICELSLTEAEQKFLDLLPVYKDQLLSVKAC